MNGRKVLLVLMIAGVIATLAVLSTSQSGRFESQGKGQRLKGVWISTVNAEVAGEPLTIHGMMKFDPDGGFLMIEEIPKHTTGFGEWTKTAEREYSYKMLKLHFEDYGGTGDWDWSGWIKSEGTLMFDNQMENGHGDFFFEVYDADWGLIFDGEGTISLTPMQ